MAYVQDVVGPKVLDDIYADPNFSFDGGGGGGDDDDDGNSWNATSVYLAISLATVLLVAAVVGYGTKVQHARKIRELLAATKATELTPPAGAVA